MVAPIGKDGKPMNKVRVCYVPIKNYMPHGDYPAHWARNTRIETVAAYAAALGRKLQWDKTSRGLVIR